MKYHQAQYPWHLGCFRFQPSRVAARVLRQRGHLLFPAGQSPPSWQTAFEPSGSNVGYGCCVVGGLNADNQRPSRAAQATCLEGRSLAIISIPPYILLGSKALSSICNCVEAKNARFGPPTMLRLRFQNRRALIAVLRLNKSPLFDDSALNASC